MEKLQVIGGKKLYIVVITEDPKTMLPIKGGRDPRRWIYAHALDAAIRTGIISEPGKYGIEVNRSTGNYDIYGINED